MTTAITPQQGAEISVGSIIRIRTDLDIPHSDYPGYFARVTYVDNYIADVEIVSPEVDSNGVLRTFSLANIVPATVVKDTDIDSSDYPAPGSWVYVIRSESPSIDGSVRKVSHHTAYCRVHGEGSSVPAIYEWVLLDTDKPTQADLEELQAKYELLVRQHEGVVSDRDAWQRRFNELDQQWNEDFDVFDEILLREARNRSWCEQFNEIVDEANGRLKRRQLSRLTKTFRLSRDVKGWLSTSVTVEVEAADEDEANEFVNNWSKEEFEEHIDGHDSIDDALTAHARTGYFTKCDFADEFGDFSD